MVQALHRQRTLLAATEGAPHGVVHGCIPIRASTFACCFRAVPPSSTAVILFFPASTFGFDARGGWRTLVLRKGKVTDYELSSRAKDGRVTLVSCNASTFRDSSGRLQGVFAAAESMMIPLEETT
jgi:hypothetical protein